MSRMVATMDGGGCPGYDVLVADLPFDFLQPPMVRGVTQAGNGGPYVVRGNPIGAIFDAIRAFCFPVPMQASSDGTQYTDLSGNGLDTYGTDLGALGQSNGGYSGFGFQDPTMFPFCQGQMPNYSTQMCVPIGSTMPTPNGGGTTPPPVTPTDMGAIDCTKMNSYDPSCYSYWNMQAANACANLDATTLTEIGVWAIGGKGLTDKALANDWATLSSNCLIWAGRIAAGKDCQGNPVKPKMMAMAMDGGMMGGMMGGGMMPPASGNPMTPNSGGPFGYIPASMPGGSNPDNNPRGSTPPMDVMNPPDMMPTETVQTRRMLFVKLPNVPDPTSLTEATPSFSPSAEPMGGSFDPARIRTPFRRPSFSQRMLGRRNFL